MHRISSLFMGGLALLLLFSMSCKSTKPLTSGEANPALSARKIIQRHYQTEANFKTLSGKLKINFSDGEQSQGVSVSFRMKKDEVIWISAPVGVVKARVTPESVSFYNRLQNEYFDGDFQYLSKLLGTEADFNLVQNLLLGNAVLDLRKERYSNTIENNTYSLKPKTANQLYKILFFLNPDNFKIAKQQISQPEEGQFLTIDYKYQTVADRIIPDRIYVLAEKGNLTNTIDLEYRNMEFNRNLNFPYKIPKGFKRIVL